MKIYKMPLGSEDIAPIWQKAVTNVTAGKIISFTFSEISSIFPCLGADESQKPVQVANKAVHCQMTPSRTPSAQLKQQAK